MRWEDSNFSSGFTPMTETDRAKSGGVPMPTDSLE